jgi:hypothetical protein
MLLILAADEQFLVGLVIVTLVAIFFLYAIPIQFLWSNFSFFPHNYYAVQLHSSIAIAMKLIYLAIYT